MSSNDKYIEVEQFIRFCEEKGLKFLPPGAQIATPSAGFRPDPIPVASAIRQFREATDKRRNAPSGSHS